MHRRPSASLFHRLALNPMTVIPVVKGRPCPMLPAFPIRNLLIAT